MPGTPPLATSQNTVNFWSNPMEIKRPVRPINNYDIVDADGKYFCEARSLHHTKAIVAALNTQQPPDCKGELAKEKERLQMLYDTGRWLGINPLQVIQYLDRLSQQAKRIGELEKWQQMVLQQFTIAENIGFCDQRKGRHKECSLDTIIEKAIAALGGKESEVENVD
jgi:hypothetical protein